MPLHPLKKNHQNENIKFKHSYTEVLYSSEETWSSYLILTLSLTVPTPRDEHTDTLQWDSLFATSLSAFHKHPPHGRGCTDALRGFWEASGQCGDHPVTYFHNWGWLPKSTQQHCIQRYLKLLLEFHFYPKIGDRKKKLGLEIQAH